MRINQFAQKNETLDTVKKELSELGFLTNETSDTIDGKKLFREFLEKSFPQFQNKSSIEDYFTRMLASTEETLADFFAGDANLSEEVFYCVALQLLEFYEDNFLTVKDFLKAAKDSGVSVIDGDFTKSETVLTAWYQLLTTHNTKGLTFLDELASRGFLAGKNLPQPYFFNGKSQAVFDMTGVIREVVYVESSLDSDEDGVRDLLKVEIIRPKESDISPVPVLFTASPYDQGINHLTGDTKMHEVNVPLTRKTPQKVSYEEIAFGKVPVELPAEREVLGTAEKATETFFEEKVYSLNDYLLARGFASVYAAGIGTKDSDGIQTCGSVEQTESMKNIVEWLAGNRRAFTNRVDQIEIAATWSNGKVAMTGRSYLGTLATAVATTGVQGLETIISEAAISNWYQYYRDNGLVVAPGGFPGEDCDVLAEETFSRSMQAGDYLKMKNFFDEKQLAMARAQDRITGNYNTFWDERNYLPHVKNIKCDVLLVHGLNDWNVKPRQVYQLWNALEKAHVAKKIILHQGQHIYINGMPSFDFHDVVNLWLSEKLYDCQNQATEILPPVIFEDNLEVEKWQGLDNWENEHKKNWYLGADQLQTAPLAPAKVTFKDHLPAKVFEKYAKNNQLWATELLEAASPMTENRFLVQSATLTEDLFLSGAPELSLKVSSSENIGLLSVQLVDYGEKKRLGVTPAMLSSKGLHLGYQWRSDALREFQLAEKTPFKMITKGHLNLQNRHNAYQVDDLKANEMVEISLQLQPTIYKVPKGHKLGLVVYATDFGMTVRGNQEIVYTLDLDQAQLKLPLQK
ncbi:Xaa-Pro dipeptidyl-peptidase [Enterococcus timonensis]|uniref:Xaa-Pro dipeptidyl-peptidase n=1 Tax=Enterococcus timonensis TaxID=1852364 RepID=UPI0008DA2410|nr:Xaa-Pro dipeptidyl-peptidase [Enterococcus timonensis]